MKSSLYNVIEPIPFKWHLAGLSLRAVTCNACYDWVWFPLMLQVKLPVLDRIQPQGNTFATGVEKEATGDSKLNDSSVLYGSNKLEPCLSGLNQILQAFLTFSCGSGSAPPSPPPTNRCYLLHFKRVYISHSLGSMPWIGPNHVHIWQGRVL